MKKYIAMLCMLTGSTYAQINWTNVPDHFAWPAGRRAINVQMSGIQTQLNDSATAFASAVVLTNQVVAPTNTEILAGGQFAYVLVTTTVSNQISIAAPAASGQSMVLINAGTNRVTIHEASPLQMAGNVNLDQYDSISFYSVKHASPWIGTNWIENARKDN